MKCQMLFFFLSATTPFYAADTKQKQEVYEISLECMQHLKNIDTDYLQLNFLFSYGIFCTPETTTISTVLNKVKNVRDDSLPKHYASATTYINLMNKHNTFFEAEFQKQLSTEKEKQLNSLSDEKDREFAVEYATKEALYSAKYAVGELFQEKLKEEVHNYKTTLLKNDAQDIIERKKTSLTVIPTVHINALFQEITKE